MLLSMRNIDKYFFGKPANQGVCLDVDVGEVHALLGENGAGKTTLMNILYGIYQRDGGEIYFEDKPVEIRSPKDSIALRIGMVHQHFTLVPTLTVSENITLGLKEKGYPFTDRESLNRDIRAVSEKYGLEIQPEKKVSELSVGEQQRVEIMKLLYRDTKLLILDEPTAVLTPQESQDFFKVIDRLRAAGRSVILITHHIPDVMTIADRVTVLRDGRSVATAATTGMTEADMSRYMIGRELKTMDTPRSLGENCGDGLCLKDVSLDEKGLKKLDHITLHVSPGEILGIAGVDGNGQKELAEAIVGLRKGVTGQISLFGEDLSTLSTRDRRAKGIGYISDDRHKDGLVMDMGLTENAMLQGTYPPSVARHGLVKWSVAKEKTREMVREYAIKTHDLETPVRYLSGGNQQKLILAREMHKDVKLILAFQPTRGLDVGASEFIREKLLAACQDGCCVLLISADLEEIFSLSNRVAVIHKGHIMGEVENGPQVDMTAVGLMMAGRNVHTEGVK